MCYITLYTVHCTLVHGCLIPDILFFSLLSSLSSLLFSSLLFTPTTDIEGYEDPTKIMTDARAADDAEADKDEDEEIMDLL